MQNTLFIYYRTRKSELGKAINDSFGEDAIDYAIKVLRGKTPVLSDLLDGAIDIDKVDYLGKRCTALRSSVWGRTGS